MVKQLATPRLPAQDSINITRPRALPSERTLGSLDAVLAVTSADASAARSWLSTLPLAKRWQQLLRPHQGTAGTSCSGELPGTVHTPVALGFGNARFTAFERLQLAGKLWQAIDVHRPQRVGIVVDAALGQTAEWYEALTAAAYAHSFALPDCRSKAEPRWRLQQLRLYGAPAMPLARITATCEATNLVRWLTALPPNLLDARIYRRLLTQLARRERLAIRIYREPALKRLGAGAFLAVTRGNATRDAALVRLRYRGRRTAGCDVALVGKGVVFDTGGINLKQQRHMLDMHTDMSGSAVALATLVALAKLRAPLNADAWLAITENNIGPVAYRPQEVVTAINGTTIQVIHSDAEGRMVLADTLALAARERPALMIDFATLTGSCVTALTGRYSGVLSNRDTLHPALLAAGMASGERVWPFPLDADYDSDLESKVADLKQCALEGMGDHILAARFLKRFVPDTVPWVHVDLSAATRSGGLGHVPTDVTGFGARFALEFLLQQQPTKGRKR